MYIYICIFLKKKTTAKRRNGETAKRRNGEGDGDFISVSGHQNIGIAEGRKYMLE